MKRKNPEIETEHFNDEDRCFRIIWSCTKAQRQSRDDPGFAAEALAINAYEVGADGAPPIWIDLDLICGLVEKSWIHLETEALEAFADYQNDEGPDPERD